MSDIAKTMKHDAQTAQSKAQRQVKKAEEPQHDENKPTLITTTPKIQRPKLTKTMFYYSTSKGVYMYTRQFWLISSVANFGEACANTVLTKLSGKNLSDVDQNLLVPVFSRVDDTVDNAVYRLIECLAQGQDFVLHTKTRAVGTASAVTNKTIETVYNAKDYSYKKASAITTSAYTTAKSTANYLYTWVPFVHVETGGQTKA